MLPAPMCSPCRHPSTVVTALLTCAILAVCSAASSTAADDELLAARRSLYDDYGARLQALADSARQQSMTDAADKLQGWLPRREPYKLVLYTSDQIDKQSLEDAPSNDLHRRFNQFRKAHANALFQLARRAVDANRAALAIQLTTEALREDPGHREARAILGYEFFGKRWRTPDEIRRFKAGQRWHPRFGWLKQDDIQRFEKGERLYNGRWITADQEATIRANIARGWQVETEHYAITTNHSLEAAVDLARRLERFYDIWWQLFAGYHLTDLELERLFARGTAPRRPRQRHKIVYFRDRDEYVASLAPLQPGVENTLGIYFGDVRIAYFFAGEDQDPGTLFHEAAHQLFQEVRPTKSIVALRDNFWLIEGIACYLESLHVFDGHATVGGLAEGRVPAARIRLLEDSFYVPFAELVTFGSRQIQRDPRIRTLYSQFAGQAAFLMHYDDGRYRDAVSHYLCDIYRGAAKAKSLAEACDVSYTELDQRYRRFLAGDPAGQPGTEAQGK